MGQGVPEKVWVVTGRRTVPGRVMGIKIPRSKNIGRGNKCGKKRKQSNSVGKLNVKNSTGWALKAKVKPNTKSLKIGKTRGLSPSLF